MDALEIRNLRKEYFMNGSLFAALKGVSLSIPAGMFAVFVGKSGCGKTTLLRLVAGLEEPTEGTVGVPGGSAPLKTGIVFQEPRLFPWLTVEENIAFPYRGKGREPPEKRLAPLIESLGLTPFRHARPGQISGGMAQRAALGRTLLYDPDTILMDEPFSALDYFTRAALRDDLLRLWRERRKTVLFVTHDVDEALCLGQRIHVMDKGEVVRTFDVEDDYPRDVSSMGGLKRDILDVIGNGKRCGAHIYKGEAQ
ncbi:MAG: ABC transporter ATP-binding protein [Synergistaceae bacterium]|nr:ABC transporter ATP-binding protein [Synergistaceae bacterium]